MNRDLRSIAAIALLAGCAALAAEEKGVYLFCFLRDNGQDGLYLCWSPDGYRWTELTPPGKTFLKPEVGGKLMRDPCIVRGPDGTFHMVWTTGWNKPPVAGYARSKDLRSWSPQTELPVMAGEPEARNVWAPELFYNRSAKTWLLFWSTTIPGRFTETALSGDNEYNHRIYCTTTTDFGSYTPTRLFYDGGFNVIDATILQARGSFHLIVKDETKRPLKRHLRIATSLDAAGPYGPAGPSFTLDWVEGPSALRIGDEYFVYFDHYAKPQYYGAVKSRDLKQWEDVSARMSFPAGMRHGTALRIPGSVARKLGAGLEARK